MLFTQYFLTEGIETTDEWKASVARPEAFAAFRDGVRKRFDDFGKVHKPNEAVTEQELIRPVLELLGWTDYLPQQGAARNEDIPDHLLGRTMIASLFPKAAFGNKVPVFLPVEAASTDSVDYKNCAVLLGGNFNSMAFDFIARQKIHGQTLNLYIVEQLPVIASSDYDRPFGATTARDLVRDHVLRLTYTAYDMAPFARDLGYDGPPFIWNEEERRHLCARLDALYFHLYGLTREEAGYVLGTFPIVRREDEVAFGNYRTRDLILAYMNALAAGDTETKVAV